MSGCVLRARADRQHLAATGKALLELAVLAYHHIHIVMFAVRVP
jgi:hypothetical protein